MYLCSVLFLSVLYDHNYGCSFIDCWQTQYDYCIGRPKVKKLVAKKFGMYIVYGVGGRGAQRKVTNLETFRILYTVIGGGGGCPAKSF